MCLNKLETKIEQKITVFTTNKGNKTIHIPEIGDTKRIQFGFS